MGLCMCETGSWSVGVSVLSNIALGLAVRDPWENENVSMNYTPCWYEKTQIITSNEASCKRCWLKAWIILCKRWSNLINKVFLKLTYTYMSSCKLFFKSLEFPCVLRNYVCSWLCDLRILCKPKSEYSEHEVNTVLVMLPSPGDYTSHNIIDRSLKVVTF